MSAQKLLLVIAGPTAVGKSAMAIELAKSLNTVVVSADSRQFYKEIPIGTAQPTTEEQGKIPHYFIASHTVHKPINASDYEEEASLLLKQLFCTYPVLVLCGGSGLYIDALCHGFDKGLPDADVAIRKMLNEMYTENGLKALQGLLKEKDPVFYQQVDLQNPNRLMRALEVCLITGKPYSYFRKGIKVERPYNILKIVIQKETPQLYADIHARVEKMLASGIEEEAKQMYPFRHLTPLKTVGYKEFTPYFEGNASLDSVANEIQRNTRHYARRQLTWFRRDASYKWFMADEYSRIKMHIEAHLHV